MKKRSLAWLGRRYGIGRMAITIRQVKWMVYSTKERRSGG